MTKWKENTREICQKNHLRLKHPPLFLVFLQPESKCYHIENLNRAEMKGDCAFACHLTKHVIVQFVISKNHHNLQWKDFIHWSFSLAFSQRFKIKHNRGLNRLSARLSSLKRLWVTLLSHFNINFRQGCQWSRDISLFPPKWYLLSHFWVLAHALI